MGSEKNLGLTQFDSLILTNEELFRGLQQLAWHRKSRAVGLCWPACCVVSSDDSCSLSPLACRLSCSVTVLCRIAQFRQSEAEQANLHILYCFNYKDSQPNHSSFTHVLIQSQFRLCFGEEVIAESCCGLWAQSHDSGNYLIHFDKQN